MPAREQQLLFSGKLLNDLQTLGNAGVKNDDMVTMQRRRATGMDSLASSLASVLNNFPRAQPRPNVNNYVSTITPFTKPTTDSPEGWVEQARGFIQAVKSQPNLYNFISAQIPQLAQAVDKNALSPIVQYLRNMATKIEEDRINKLAIEQPNHPDVQRHIEEQIRQKAIDEQWEHAMEHNPEAFASVVMLYCAMEVNGHPVTALIDSGAQMTIMSKSCAERCGLMRYVDTRMASLARGVGESKILGKIHSAMLKVGSQLVDVSISVIEQNTLEFIFGLDMMRKHRAVIDLREDVLLLGDEKIRFLTEGQMPDRLRGSNSIKTSAEIARERQVLNEIASQSSAPESYSDPSIDPAKVRALMETVGASEAAAREALRVSNGDVEAAASYLLSMLN